MSERNSSRKKPVNTKITSILAGVAAVLVILAIGLFTRLDSVTPGSGPTIGGPFSLVGQNGATVSDTDYRGKMMLIYFGYTFCPDICPTTLGSVARAFDQLTPQQRSQVVPIFITVDPERDTADQMTQYVGNFMPDLVGLTGSPEQVQKVMLSFRVYARKTDNTTPNYSVDHSSVLYLMDRDGKFVRPFPGSISANDLAAGLKKVL